LDPRLSRPRHRRRVHHRVLETDEADAGGPQRLQLGGQRRAPEHPGGVEGANGEIGTQLPHALPGGGLEGHHHGRAGHAVAVEEGENLLLDAGVAGAAGSVVGFPCPPTEPATTASPKSAQPATKTNLINSALASSCPSPPARLTLQLERSSQPSPHRAPRLRLGSRFSSNIISRSR